MSAIRSLLADYFPVGLENSIKTAVLIKSKVISHSLYMVTLDVDGVATIIDLASGYPRIVKSIRNIHNIFGGEGVAYERIFQEVHFLTNKGHIGSIDNPEACNSYLELGESLDDDSDDSESLTDIIHIVNRGAISVYTNVHGEISINSSDGLSRMNFPEPIVTTAVTDSSIVFLAVSGVARIYHSPVVVSYVDSYFDEFTKEYWEDEKEEIDLEDLIVKGLKDTLLPDVIKICAADTIAVITLNNKTLYIDNWPNGWSNPDSVDIVMSTEGPILELLLNKRVRSNEILLAYIKDIIAVSSGEYSALVQADGRVLVKSLDDQVFTSIPRLRLTV